ncbi:MAG: PEGA domain-containing protein, partial [Nanoarchaeota archaeon]
MIKRLEFKTGLIYLAIAVIVILMLIFGKNSREEIGTLENELGLGESQGSGFLEVETFPSDADIYVDGILKGKSPDTLYNIPAGMHNIAIKKEGYGDYSVDVDVEAGKKAFIEADLAALVEEPEVPEVEEIIEEAIEETKPIVAIEEEKIAEEPESLEGKNIINIGKKLQFYYDFSDGKFT